MVNKYINATYQEIYDIATTPNKVTIIGIRTPSGGVPSKMLEGLWKQFKSVKYNGMDFVMRASGTQPLDPLQVGTSAGSKMDMRDIQNPILFRGCHGESLGPILNDLMGLGSGDHGFTGDSLDIDSTDLDATVENFYYQCLTDMSWQKSMPQNGFARNGLHPLVYGLASNHQLIDAGIDKFGNDVDQNVGDIGIVYNDQDSEKLLPPNLGAQISADGTRFMNGGRRIFTNDLQPLGWMDTENRVGGDSATPFPNARIPRCYMGILMLPPSYTEGVRQYYRVVCTHYLTFKDFRSISLDGDYTSTPGYYNTLNLSKESDAVLTSARVR